MLSRYFQRPLTRLSSEHENLSKLVQRLEPSRRQLELRLFECLDFRQVLVRPVVRVADAEDSRKVVGMRGLVEFTEFAQKFSCGEILFALAAFVGFDFF